VLQFHQRSLDGLVSEHSRHPVLPLKESL